MDIMNLFGSIRDMIFNAWANVAMWLGFMDRRVGETSIALVRRGILRSLIIHSFFFILLIGSTLITYDAGRYITILLLIPTLLSLALFWATTAFIPIAVAHLTRAAGALPDANFFENLASPIPTGSVAISKYRNIALWETALALYISIARYFGADLTLLWMTIIAVFVIILAGSSPKGSARMFSSIAKMIVLVTVVMQFWGNGRDAFFNKSWTSFISPSRERVEDKRQKDALDKAIGTGGIGHLRLAFEMAPLDSKEEGDAYDALLAKCQDELRCLPIVVAYKDSIIALKSPRRVERVSERSTTSPMAPSVTTFSGGRFAGEIPNASIDRLRELYIIYVPDGRLDNMILARAREIGADDYEIEEWKIDRREARFDEYNTVLIYKVVFGEEWSSRIFTGGTDQWTYSVDGARVWNIQNDKGQTILNAGVKGNMTRSFMRGARWLKFQIDASDLDAGPGSAWVVRR